MRQSEKPVMDPCQNNQAVVLRQSFQLSHRGRLLLKIMEGVRAECDRKEAIRKRQGTISNATDVLCVRCDYRFRDIKPKKVRIDSDHSLSVRAPQQISCDMSVSTGEIQYRFRCILNKAAK